MFQKGEFWDKFLLFTSHPVCGTFLWQPKPSKTSPGGKVHWMIVLLQGGGWGFKEGRESQVPSQQEVLTCFIFTPHIEPLTSMTKRMFLGIGSMFSGAKKWTKYPLNTWKTEHICGPNHYQCLECRKMGIWGWEERWVMVSRTHDSCQEENRGGSLVSICLSLLPVPSFLSCEGPSPLSRLPPQGVSLLSPLYSPPLHLVFVDSLCSRHPASQQWMTEPLSSWAHRPVEEPEKWRGSLQLRVLSATIRKIKVPRMPSGEASNSERGVFPKDMASTLDLRVSLELACQHWSG